jgi:hypothetical protein
MGQIYDIIKFLSTNKLIMPNDQANDNDQQTIYALFINFLEIQGLLQDMTINEVIDTIHDAFKRRPTTPEGRILGEIIKNPDNLRSILALNRHPDQDGGNSQNLDRLSEFLTSYICEKFGDIEAAILANSFSEVLSAVDNNKEKILEDHDNFTDTIRDCPKFNLKQSNKFLVIISHKANIYIALWLIY